MYTYMYGQWAHAYHNNIAMLYLQPSVMVPVPLIVLVLLHFFVFLCYICPFSAGRDLLRCGLAHCGRRLTTVDASESSGRSVCTGTPTTTSTTSPSVEACEVRHVVNPMVILVHVIRQDALVNVSMNDDDSH